MSATVTSFGDYDQCINIHGSDYSGSHCMVQVRMNIGNVETEVDVLLNETNPKFGHFYPIHGLCMPSTCSSDEIRSIVSKTLDTFPLLSVQGHFKCDTKKSISYESRFKQLTKSQWTSL